MLLKITSHAKEDEKNLMTIKGLALMVFVPLILFAHLLSSSSFAFFFAGILRRQTNTTIAPIMTTTTTPTTAPTIAAVLLLFAEAWQSPNGGPHSP
jgi:hypothetical protein